MAKTVQMTRKCLHQTNFLLGIRNHLRHPRKDFPRSIPGKIRWTLRCCNVQENRLEAIRHKIRLKLVKAKEASALQVRAKPLE